MSRPPLLCQERFAQRVEKVASSLVAAVCDRRFFHRFSVKPAVTDRRYKGKWAILFPLCKAEEGITEQAGP